jgi:membrane peptidoglycan carboxypeptidase
MQTSLARRQRHRRNGHGGRGTGGSAASKVAIALPLFLFGTFVLLAFVGAAGAVGAYNYYSQGLEDPKKLLEGLTFTEETVVYDRTGKVELARFGEQRRDVVTFEQIPPWLVDATTAVEDKTFWENAGFDPVGIVSAAFDTLSGNARGASTITQQLVRDRLLSADAKAGPNYERKIREIIQSIKLTQEYPGVDGKKKIMETYLNNNFYGNRSYGVKAAARSYFGITDLSKLTLAQAAILAGIPQSPTTNDLMRNAEQVCSVQVAEGADCPAGKTRLEVPSDNPIVERRNKILDLMQTRSILSKGQFTAADFDAARKSPVVLTPPPSSSWLAPHFVNQVRHQLGTILCGVDQADNCEAVDTGGYKVITTLDWNLQKKAEKWVKAAAIAPNRKDTAAYLKTIGVSYASWIRDLKGRGIYNAALGAVDYRTGQILAYVGSGSYYEKARGKKFQPKFDVLGDGWRQPGSAFKPINYLTGLEDKTMTASTMFMDVTTNFGGGYTPADADRAERGPVRMRQAIQLSLNIPAVKAALISGPDHVFEFAKKMGIEWQSAKNPAGGSIGIGTVELHFIDLISAYGTIGNAGVLMPRTAIMSVTNGDDTPLYPSQKDPLTGKRVITAQNAWIMQDILASNTDPKANPFWSKRALSEGGRRRPATLKTGTTNDEIDLAAMGFVAPPSAAKDPAIVAGAWMGNSDNSAPPRGTVALETAASLWQAFMQDAMRGRPIAQFNDKPKGVNQVAVDANSGMLPGPFTRRTFKEWFATGTAPKQVDDTKVGVTVDGATKLLWQDGCLGPQKVVGALDLSGVDAGHPAWQKADRSWAARAARGPGVGGGLKGTRTAYFGFGSIFPFGATWGAPFAPRKTCPIGGPNPTPLPSESPLPSGEPTPTPPPTKKP